jgi:hypothetical protein
MDDQVRSELADLLKTGGRNLCTMPRMVSILLRQRCPDAESTVSDVEQALAFGSIRSMLEAVGPVDVEELTARLVKESGMTSDRARWVIETWVLALAAADTPPPLGRDWAAWNRLDVTTATAGGGGAYQRAVGHLVVVGLAGTVGGAVLGAYFLIGGEAAMIGPWQDAVQDVPPWLRGAALLTLGMLGGFAGGLFGWMFAGGRSWTYDALGDTTVGRLALTCLGAMGGGGIGVLAGLELLGLIGVMLGALLGALIGAVLGLLCADGISRFWR